MTEQSEEARTVDEMVAEARAAWVGIMAQYTEMPVGVFEEAFDVVIKLGAQRGRIEGVEETFARMQALFDRMETDHEET